MDREIQWNKLKENKVYFLDGNIFEIEESFADMLEKFEDWQYVVMATHKLEVTSDYKMRYREIGFAGSYTIISEVREVDLKEQLMEDIAAEEARQAMSAQKIAEKIEVKSVNSSAPKAPMETLSATLLKEEVNV